MLIGEIARQANVSKDTVRLYERKGFIHSSPIAAGSRTYNDYPEAAVKIVKDIRQARVLGVSLQDWKMFYDEWIKPDLSNVERHALLDT